MFSSPKLTPIPFDMTDPLFFKRISFQTILKSQDKVELEQFIKTNADLLDELTDVHSLEKIIRLLDGDFVFNLIQLKQKRLAFYWICLAKYFPNEDKINFSILTFLAHECYFEGDAVRYLAYSLAEKEQTIKRGTPPPSQHVLIDKKEKIRRSNKWLWAQFSEDSDFPAKVEWIELPDIKGFTI